MHTKIILFLAISLSARVTAAPERREDGALVFDGIPLAPPALQDRLEQYENVRSATLHAWTPEGIYLSTRFGESNQLHRVEGPMRYRQQLTFASEPIARAFPRPGAQELIYLKDTGGNEFSQIYRFDLGSGKSTLLSDGKSKNAEIEWQKSGKAFAFSSTRRNGKDSDLYLMRSDQSAEQATLILKEGGTWSPLDWDEKGERLLVEKAVSANENFLFILEPSSRKLTPVLPGGGFAFQTALWSKDGRSIFLAMDRDGEFQTLYRLSVADGKLEAISASIPWNVENMELSPDGKTLAFVINENGIDKIHLYDTQSRKLRKAPAIPSGVIGRLAFHSKDSQRLAFSLSHAQGPSDIYAIHLREGKAEPWTRSEVGGLNRETFVAAQTISFPSFDQEGGKARSIPAFYFPGRNPSQTPTPVVILIHGGPESQFQPGFNPSIQYLANELGVAVIAPNVRGSSGYGKTYLQLDNGFKREDSVKDIGALLDWIATQKHLDSGRVIVMGGSYGGYMVLASLVHFGDRLAGGIDNVGISHFVTFLNNTQDYRRDLRRVEYGDERLPEMKKFLEDISPLTQVKKIRKPLLVVQGLNDPRVPASEAEQIVKAVREQGIESWYLLGRDEGHGFQKKKNQAAYMQTVMMFVEKLIAGDGIKSQERK